MPSKEQTHSNDKTSSKQRSPKPATGNLDILTQQQTCPATLIQRAKLDPGSLTPRDVLQLQRTIGNQAVGRLLAQHHPIQKKKNNTGLPDNLKAGVENISGMSKNVIQLVREYTHLVIDKENVGLDNLRMSLNENGLQTAQNRNIELSEGSQRLGHHQHVFMWDSSKRGIEGSVGIEIRGGTVKAKIRMEGLQEPRWYRKGNLKGDNMGPLGGTSTTGAWAYEGDIPRKYLFIEGMDDVKQPGFDDWFSGKGWPEDHAELASRRYGYTEIE